MKTISAYDCSVLRKTPIAYPFNMSAFFVAVDCGYADPDSNLDEFQETAAIFCAHVAANQGGVSNPDGSIAFECAMAQHCSPHALHNFELAADNYTPFFVTILDKAFRSMRNAQPRIKINVDQLHYDLMHWSDAAVRRKWITALVDKIRTDLTR